MPGISYYTINYDIDGPNSNSIYMKPLQAESPVDNILGISQLKSFDHYLWEKTHQQNAVNTEREVEDDVPHTLTLPSLKPSKYKDRCW